MKRTGYKKKKIPKAIREAVWINYNGHTFDAKCNVQWCPNRITAYDFTVGHNIPESKGGATTVENLVPICSRCNQSMGNFYTITEWNTLGKASVSKIPLWRRFLGRFFSCITPSFPTTVAPAPSAPRTTLPKRSASPSDKSQGRQASTTGSSSHAPPHPMT
jgi:HNH endonuclease